MQTIRHYVLHDGCGQHGYYRATFASDTEAIQVAQRRANTEGRPIRLENVQGTYVAHVATCRPAR
jgi:hypothetical protein